MQIGPYEVLDELGQGGMGTVYRALQPSVNRVVALKVLSPLYEKEATFVRRFQQEAETSAGLAHENIVRIWDASVSHPPYYIAMEYMPGGTLAARLAHGSLPLAEAAFITGQLCAALDYAHRRGVIHRDIKPENIIFNEQGRPALTDFGIARGSSLTVLTMDGSKLGTPDYMSPEQLKGLKVDHRIDLYSLAVVLYEMLCGRPPFSNEEILATLRQIVDEPPPPPRFFNPSIPPAVEAVMLRGMAKTPNGRFQSGVEFAAALGAACQGPAVAVKQRAVPAARIPVAAPPVPILKPRIAKPPRAGLSRRRLLLATLVSVVILGAGLLTAYTLIEYGGRPAGGGYQGPSADASSIARSAPPVNTAAATTAAPAATQEAPAKTAAPAAAQEAPVKTAAPQKPPEKTPVVVPETYAASGRVTDEADEGIEGVVLNFSNGLGRTETDADGNWRKGGLKGDVTVAAAKEGWEFARGSWRLSSKLTKASFTATRTTYSASGSVRLGSGEGIASVTLTLTGGDGRRRTALTGPDGTWEIGGLSGAVEVTAIKSGYEFTPRSATLTREDNTAHFRDERQVYEVSGFVFQGKTGMKDVRVAANSGQSTVTDANGYWRLTGLRGTVTISLELGAQWVVTPPNVVIRYESRGQGIAFDVKLK